MLFPVEGARLIVSGLSHRFGSQRVLGGIDLDIRAGERLALLGPNGSGKTTLLRCAAGTLSSTGGEVLVDGHRSGTLAAQRLTGVSLSQERSFYLRLTARQNLVFFARLRRPGGHAAEQEVDALADELELRELLALPVDRCSTGMVQQLGFARALLGAPRLVLLDEPTRSLDDAALERFWGALEARAGLTVLLATHRSEDVDRCHRRVRLH
jgi:ABC-2 type transport system ATP-binding protein